MQLGLIGKVVVVTGGTKGIGRRIVEAFLTEGAQVHFCSRTEAEVQACELELKNGDKQVYGKVVDVSNHKSLAEWIEEIGQQHAGIDVVVSNVSALNMSNTADAWLQTFNIDMMSAVTIVNTALPYLEKSRGNIISISSVSGRDVDFTATSPYGSIKAALIHYGAQLAHTLAGKGIRSNTVSPGNIYIKDGVWGTVEKNSPDFFKQQMKANPMGRMGKPEEVADAVLFLASERASFISGANLVVDGALCTGVQF